MIIYKYFTSPELFLEMIWTNLNIMTMVKKFNSQRYTIKIFSKGYSK